MQIFIRNQDNNTLSLQITLSLQVYMLSYQHGYHAGGFADVVKHITLTRLLSYMVSKDKPMLYLETHSGKGLYDLHDKQTLKTGEAAQGIDLIWQQRKKLPAVFLPYIQQIEQLNTGNNIRYYPGSPSIALHHLRKQDRLILCELHPGEFEHLKQLPKMGKRVFYKNDNGLDMLNATMPPIERRGLMFLDPSYEIKTEYRHIPEALKIAYRRFETGVYCLWYPLVDNKLHSQLLRGLEGIDAPNNLRIEFSLSNTHKGGMTGCGLWIINPPYILQSEIKSALDVLRTVFNPSSSFYLIEH